MMALFRKILSSSIWTICKVEVIIEICGSHTAENIDNGTLGCDIP
jgi:hypothetical protein